MIKYGLYIKEYVNSFSGGVQMFLKELEEDGKPIVVNSQKAAVEYLAKYHIKYLNTPQSIEGCDILIIPQMSF